MNMNMITPNTKLLIIGVICIIVIIIVYKLHKNDSRQIESFESILNKLSTKNNKKKNNTSKSKSKFTNINNDSKHQYTLDDVFKASENLDPDKYSLDNMSKDLTDYKKSFKTNKFKNDSKTTAESFAKFALYKEKFFEIFD